MSEVALFENALRAAVPSRPDPLDGADLVRRLAATARAATLEAEVFDVGRRTNGHSANGAAPVRRRRLGLVAKVAVAMAVIPLALAGLAFAGVNLPQPAQDAFNAVGIDLPNQPSEHPEGNGQGKSGGGNDVSSAAKSKSGTQQGNSAAAHQHARDQRGKAHGKAVGHTRGNAIGLNDGTPPGQGNQPAGQDKEPQSHGQGQGQGQDNGAPGQAKEPPGQAKQSDSAENSNSGGNSDLHANDGAGQLNPLPPQANSRTVVRSDLLASG